MGPDNGLRSSLKKYFISGILVIVPLIITYQVLKFLLGSIDGILAPLMSYLGYNIPGLGILVMLLLILLAGVLTRGMIGRQLVHTWERLLVRLPLVRTVYSSSKQLLSSLYEPRDHKFRRVVIIPYPRHGMYCFAFAGSDISLDATNEPGEYVAVFVPSTPTPFTGFTLMVKKEEVFPIDISVEESIKFVVSGGVVRPEKFMAVNNDPV